MSDVHDFTTKGTRNPKAKQDTRRRPLDLVRRHSAHLWSRSRQHLRHDWMELAGTRAPTLQMLLDEQALISDGPTKFIGVDTSAKVLAGCRSHYGPDAPALWERGRLDSLLRDTQAFQNVGVLVFDSFRAIKGQRTIERDLRVLGRFAHRQEERLGEFLLVCNVAQRWVDNEGDIENYKRLLSGHFNIPQEQVDLHRYVSRRMPMLWTALRLGF